MALGDQFLLWACIITLWVATGVSWWLFAVYVLIGLALNSWQLGARYKRRR